MASSAAAAAASEVGGHGASGHGTGVAQSWAAKRDALLAELEEPPPVVGSEEERAKREKIVEGAHLALISLYRNESAALMLQVSRRATVRDPAGQLPQGPSPPPRTGRAP